MNNNYLKIKLIKDSYKKFNKEFGKINIFIILINEIYKYVFNYNYKNKFINSYFPHINNNYKKTNFKISVKIKLTKQNFIKNIISSIKDYRKQTKNVRFNVDNFTLKKAKARNNFLNINFNKLFLNDLSAQKYELGKFLDKIKKLDKIKNIYYVENFINFYSELFSDSEKNKKVIGKNLYIGSNQIIHNRIMSAKYLIEKKNVKSINHTNFSYAIFEKNASTDSEHSLCSHYYDYTDNRKNNYFNELNERPTFLKIKKKRISSSLSSYQEKYLYIPKKFHGHKRYFGGIYNDISDNDYHKIQKKILSFNNKILLKKHPKNFVNFKYSSMENRIISKKLSEEFLSKFRLSIVDTITQPFFDLANSNIKIIFFDYLNQDFNQKFYKLLKDRVLVIKKNPKNISKKKFNYYLKKGLKFKIKNKKILFFSKYL